MNDHELWTLIRKAWTALSPHYESEIECIIVESDLESRVWGVLLAVLTIEPDLTTPAHLLVRVPYTAAELYLARLKSAKNAGYLTEAEPGKYRLSSKGRIELNRFINDARTAMSAADPLPGVDSKRLAGLLEKLVHSCINTEPPPNTWSIRLSYKIMPPKDPAMPYIEQEFSCLSAYRDDAHLAAWQESGLSATALETLTLIWRGEANSITAIAEGLEYRGHSIWVYADALAFLRERGYITGDDDRLTITPAGKYFRDHVEADTDRYFFAPWSCLTNSEKSELGNLLEKMSDGLKITDLAK